jgi:hypothetical protein
VDCSTRNQSTEIEVKNLDHLGLVAGIIDEIGIVEIINEQVSMNWVIRVSSLIEKDIWRFLSIVFDLERTNQLSLLPDKDLVNLCPPIAPYQVTKNPSFLSN